MSKPPVSSFDFYKKHKRHPKTDADWAEIERGKVQIVEDVKSRRAVYAWLIAVIVLVLGYILGVTYK